MKMIKIGMTWKVIGLAIVLSAGVRAAEISQTEYTAPHSEPPRREVETHASVQATVQAIDRKKRLLTIKNEAGEIVEMEIGSEVQRFDQIKKGDSITIDYLESKAIFVRKPKKGEKPATSSDSYAMRTQGHKPGASGASSAEVTAEVMKVDYKARKITLKGPDGQVETFDVPQKVKRLNEIKKGDFVVAQHSMAVAIAVH